MIQWWKIVIINALLVFGKWWTGHFCYFFKYQRLMMFACGVGHRSQRGASVFFIAFFFFFEWIILDPSRLPTCCFNDCSLMVYVSCRRWMFVSRRSQWRMILARLRKIFHLFLISVLIQFSYFRVYLRFSILNLLLFFSEPF